MSIIDFKIILLLKQHENRTFLGCLPHKSINSKNHENTMAFSSLSVGCFRMNSFKSENFPESCKVI